MIENESKVTRKLDEVLELVSEFGSQSKQLKTSKENLQKATQVFESYAKTILQEIRTIFGKQDLWNQQTTDDISNICYDFNTSFESLQNILKEDNFHELCQKIGELARLLEEYKSARDELTNALSEVKAIRAQQAADRAFMEEKFAIILELITPPITE